MKTNMRTEKKFIFSAEEVTRALIDRLVDDGYITKNEQIDYSEIDVSIDEKGESVCHLRLIYEYSPFCE